jgi:GNAT superfamily N-acetyltransferase
MPDLGMGRRSRETISSTPLSIRALEVEDLPAATVAVAASFELDLDDPATSDHWDRRIELPLSTDPEGCFLAEREGRVIGVAQAIRRERLWCLSLLAVTPEAQSAGAGRALLERALDYGAGSDAGLIPSSNDPRALRLYALAGFSVLPTFEASGAIDRGSLSRSHPEVREGGVDDLEALEPISRRIRGAPHTRELEFALSQGGELLRLGDRGFAVFTPGQGVWLLVAGDEPAAAALLWSSLALCGEPARPPVRWITGEQQWAIEVALRAGLRLAPNRALAVRGRPGPLRPFLPSGPFA